MNTSIAITATTTPAAHKLSKGTTYHVDTPAKVISILNSVMHDEHSIIRIFYGCHDTGVDWCNENDVVGFVGRSSGSRKIPLLLEPLRYGSHSVTASCGGGGLLDSSIVRIINVSTGEELYRTKRYKLPEISVQTEQDERMRAEGYVARADRDGQNWARFKSWEDAGEYVAFLQGFRAARPYRTRVEADREDVEFQRSLQD